MLSSWTKTSKSIELYHFMSNASGKVWFDRIRLEEVK